MNLRRFAKLSGAGNDFVIADNREGAWGPVTPEQVLALCRHRYAVGADGLILMEHGRLAPYAMRYYNADGSEASMCGNGARCLARFTVLLGLVPEGGTVALETRAGVVTAVVQGHRVRLSMTPPQGWQTDVPLALKHETRTADVVDTGVPHAVLYTGRLDAEPVGALGREIRHHPHFAPAGTNVNFCQVLDAHRLAVRTYERGVEAETLACGTGAAAAALAAARRGLVSSPVTVETRSGETLEMTFAPPSPEFADVTQTGSARLIYWGELSEEAGAYQAPGI